MSAPARLSVHVAAAEPVATGIRRFELVPDGAGPLPAFTAGAHIDVHIADGLVRPYSLCNDPAERHRYVIAVLQDPGSRGGSVAMHERIRVGDRLTISVPRNHFELAPAAHTVLMAGGIGITPLLAMAATLHRQGTGFELHYGARSADRMAFKTALESAAYREAVTLYVDTGPAARQLDVPRVLRGAAVGAHLYVCGPVGFIEHVLQSARQGGWPEERLHREFFGAPAGVAAVSDMAAFGIRLRSDGRTFEVPADKSVAQVLAEAGVGIPLSCEAGVCGTCLTRVLEGIPDHRDLYLSDAEHARNDCFTPCCSRSKSAVLVLDL